MAFTENLIIENVKKYLKELQKNNIPVEKAILFGSCIRGTFREESDIDVAIISTAFTGDRFADRRKIVPLRRKIDNRIEPMPFSPDDFSKGGNLIDEIKKTGSIIS